MASIKNYGISGIGSDVQLGKNGGRIIYDTANTSFSFTAGDGVTLETVVFGSLSDGSLTIDNFDNDSSLTANSATVIATQQAVKTYVDNLTNAGAMLTAADTGSGSIIFASETFTLSGTANEIETRFEGTNTFRVGIVDDPTITGNLTVNGSQGITDGVATLAGGNLTTTGNIDANAIEFNSLSGASAVTITDFSTATNLGAGAASDSLVPTQLAVKTYIDTELSAGGLAMNLAGDTGNGSIVFSSETYNVFGTANQITTTFDGAATMTFSLPDDLIAPSNLTVTNNLTTSLTATRVPFIGTGGLLSESAGLTYTNGTSTLTATNTTVTGTLQFASITDGTLTINQFIDEDSMVSNLANALPTQQSVKAYVDSEVGKYAILTINADGSTQGNVNLFSQELSIIGTANEVETNMTNQTLQIGLPTNVRIGGNIEVVGSLLSNDITATTVTINGDSIVTGNLTVQGTTTVVDSTVVQIADATLLVNSDGAVVSSGLEANINGVTESVLYVPGNSRWELSGDVYTATDLTVGGTVEFGGLSGTGAVTVTDILDEDNMASNSDTALVTQQSIKAYVDNSVGAATAASNLTFTADNATTGTINIATEILQFVGGTNINTSVDGAGGNVITINLDDSVSTGNVTATGTLQFGTLTDGTDTITSIISAADTIVANDDDNSVPTTAAVIDYVATNSGDGLVLRGAFTANGSATTFDIGTVPNVTGRTYYPDKVVLSVGTGFAGGSFNHVIVKDNNGAGTTLVAESDADAAVAAIYVIEIGGATALTKNATVQLQFFQSNGTTPAAPTAGQVTATVHYNWV